MRDAEPAEDEFWARVDRAHLAAAARSELNTRLRARLSDAGLVLAHLERELDDPAGFQRTLLAVHQRAYRRDIWTAFDLALGGIDEITLADAVSWLVLSGRSAYAAVLADPDALAELAIDERDLADAAGLDTVAAAAFPADASEDRIDAFLEHEPERNITQVGYPGPPPGDPLPGDLAVLRARFPRLTDRHVPRVLTRLPHPLPSLRRADRA